MAVRVLGYRYHSMGSLSGEKGYMGVIGYVRWLLYYGGSM